MNYHTVNFDYPRQQILDILSDCKPMIVQPLDYKKIFFVRRALGLNVKLRIISILYFQLDPNFTGSIHIDGDLNRPGTTPNFAFNLPLLNCDNTVMHWFNQRAETKPTILPAVTHSDGKILWLRDDNAIKIDSVTCNKPNFVKIDDWHSVDNYGTLGSKFISVRFALNVRQEDVIPHL